MNVEKSFAEKEFDILEKNVPDDIVLPFRKEIVALYNAFMDSDQSGSSAPYTASAIIQTIKKLLMFNSICDITGDESEWVDINNDTYQNNRCAGVFKKNDMSPYYIDAIVWKNIYDNTTFTGYVYVDNSFSEMIGSFQYIKFPFQPKTFFIDVIDIPISKEDVLKNALNKEMHYTQDNNDDYYVTILKDPKQLDEVFEYYDKM